MESTKLGRSSRRKWLLSIGSAIGASAALVALRTYLTPPTNEPGHTERLGLLDEVVADGQQIVVSVDGQRMLVARQGASVTAMDLTCTHASCPLHVTLSSKKIQCQCHGGAFDLQGRPIKGPPTQPLRRYNVRVEHGVLYVRIPSRGSA